MKVTKKISSFQPFDQAKSSVLLPMNLDSVYNGIALSSVWPPEDDLANYGSKSNSNIMYASTHELSHCSLNRMSVLKK